MANIPATDFGPDSGGRVKVRVEFTFNSGAFDSIMEYLVLVCRA